MKSFISCGFFVVLFPFVDLSGKVSYFQFSRDTNLSPSVQRIFGSSGV